VDDTKIFMHEWVEGSKGSLEQLMKSTPGQLINKALAAVLYCPNEQNTKCSGHPRKQLLPPIDITPSFLFTFYLSLSRFS
jgi:hypothetical protein